MTKSEQIAKLTQELAEVRGLLTETTEQLKEKRLEYWKLMDAWMACNRREDEDINEINNLKRDVAMWQESFRLVGERAKEAIDQLAQLKAEKK